MLRLRGSIRKGNSLLNIETITSVRKLSHMISWSPDEVERRFALLGIPNRFMAQEKASLTTNVGDIPEGVIAFPTPSAAEGLNILNIRRILGTDSSRQPSFFDHPWFLDEPFGRSNCSPGWHILHSTVLPDSISRSGTAFGSRPALRKAWLTS